VEVLAREGPGRGPEGVRLAGEAARVAVAAWIGVGSCGRPRGADGGASADAAAGCGRGNRARGLFGGGNPPSPECAARYFKECVMTHHTQGEGGSV
jgi:hypothetical protein